MSSEAPRPRGRSLGLPLRIYLIALLPLVFTGLIIGAVDFFSLGPSISAAQGAPAVPPLRFLLLPVGLLLFLLAIAAILFARSLVRPISHLAHTAAAFGAGDLDARATLDRGDELGDLALAFDDMADQITHLMRAQKALLANISHELRTPLTRIRLALDLVELEASGDSDPHLSGITEDLLELEKLVSNIMMTARLDLESGRAGQVSLPVHLEPVESRSILDAAVARFRQKNPARQLDVVLERPLPTIDADRVLLRRVVDNLLDNARKYSPAESAVTLRARSGGPGLEVEVIDQGTGIGSEDQRSLCTPFFRTDESRTRATGGVGLGLYLSRQIVESHGGSISIESERGRGTLVRFSIPALERPS